MKGKNPEIRKKSGQKKKRQIRRKVAPFCLAGGILLAGCAALLRERLVLFPLAGAGALLLAESILLFLKKRYTAAIVIIAVLSAALIGISPATVHTIRYEGGTPDNVTELSFHGTPEASVRLFRKLETADVTDSSVTDFSFLKKLPSLRVVNARGNTAFTDEVRNDLAASLPETEFIYTRTVSGVSYDTDAPEIDMTAYPRSPEEIEAVIAAYPDKQVLYTVHLWGEDHDASETALALSEDSEFDRAEFDAAIRLMPEVKSVDLTGTMLDAESIRSLLTDHSGISFKYRVILWGEGHLADETSLTLPQEVPFHQEELDQALAILPLVTSIDLTTQETDALTANVLTMAHPAIGFVFTFRAGETVFRSDIEKISVTGDPQSYTQYFAYMPKLKVADMEDAELSSSLIDALIDEYPGIEFYYSMSMFGVTVHSTDRKISLDGNNVPSVKKFESYLKYLPNLQAVSMCGCGLSNSEMASLREKYPDIKFVWKISFGKYTLRTDATMFTTGLRGDNHYNYTSKTFEPLKYCTDLKFLDLGHNHIVDISFLKGMTDLRVLILACNKIEDISVLKDMNDLEYVELFSNHIKDFSALEGKTKLVDLNINRNKIKSIAPIKSCTALERLWIGSCGLSSSQLGELKKALPKADINTSAGDYPTTAGWREHKRYKIIQKMYNEEKYIPFD